MPQRSRCVSDAPRSNAVANQFVEVNDGDPGTVIFALSVPRWNPVNKRSSLSRVRCALQGIITEASISRTRERNRLMCCNLLRDTVIRAILAIIRKYLRPIPFVILGT